MTNKEELKKKNLELAKQLGIELTPQPSKLEQCIKEWESRGFKCIRFSNALKFENKSEDITINIQEWNGSVMITDSNYCYARNISYDLHNLINKTLKALENYNETK